MTSAYARTLRQVVNDAQRLCNDYIGDGKDGRLWTWLEMRAMAQDALLEMVMQTGMLRDSKVVFLQADTQVYNLPGDCMRLLRVGINVIRAQVMIPTSIAERDYAMIARSETGSAYSFYRDHSLAPNQIGVMPIPDQDGSSFVRDSDYGLLRKIEDEGGNKLPFDYNRPLRRITGVPFSRSGSGRIIRELISLYGNMQVSYVRAPAKWTKPGDYPDSDIPEYLHKEIKYGLAARALRGSRQKAHVIKRQWFAQKWASAINGAMRNSEHQGVNYGAVPV